MEDGGGILAEQGSPLLQGKPCSALSLSPGMYSANLLRAIKVSQRRYLLKWCLSRLQHLAVLSEAMQGQVRASSLAMFSASKARVAVGGPNTLLPG